jgi:Ca-activated chloride channel family protein
MIRRRFKIALLFLLASAPWTARAQAPPGPLPPKPGAPVQQPPKDAPQIKVKVDLVTTPAIVRDARGQLVLNLEKKDFRIFDNDVEQQIEDFDLGGESLSFVIAVETSSRIEPLLPAVRKLGILLTQNVIGPNAEAALLQFDDHVRQVLPFTRDHDAMEKSVANLKMGYSGLVLYDAMARGVSLLKERPPDRRRILVVISEAADTESESKLGEVLREAQLSNVTIYSVGLSTTAALLRKKPDHYGPKPLGPEGTFPVPGRAGQPQTPTSEQQEASRRADLLAAVVWAVTTLARTVKDNALEVATTATGGMHVSTFKDSSLESALSEIGDELHAQYTLTYRPIGTGPGGFHEIKVVLTRGDLSVRSRPGYYLEP